MKKLLITLAATALTASVYAMSNPPADDSACGADKKACVKEAAACCTTDGSCKTEDAAKCADKAACSAEKAVEEKAECVGGICPLKK